MKADVAAQSLWLGEWQKSKFMLAVLSDAEGAATARVAQANLLGVDTAAAGAALDNLATLRAVTLARVDQADLGHRLAGGSVLV